MQRLACVSLLHDHTGSPLFILPVSDRQHPQLMHLTALDSITEYLGKPTSLSDQLNHQAIDLFFNCGGQSLLIYALPYRPNEGMRGLMRAFMGHDAGFNRRRGIYQLLDHHQAIDLMAAPTLSRLLPANDLYTIQQRLIDMANCEKGLFVLLDPPYAAAADELIAYAKKFNTDRAALYAAKLYDASSRQRLPVSVVAAASIQRNDQERTIEDSPANLPLPLASYYLELYDDLQMEKLLAAQINSMTSHQSGTAVIWGGKTLCRTDNYQQYISCSRYLQAMIDAMETIMEPFVFSLATDAEASKAEAAINYFFTNYYSPTHRHNLPRAIKPPRFSVQVLTNDQGAKYFNLDLSVYLAVPMTWVDVQISMDR